MVVLEIHKRQLNTAVISLLVLISAIACQSPCANVSLVATNKFSYISSSTYSSNNVSMRDCHWHITTGSDENTVLVEFTSFDLKGLYFCSPFLAIYDGPSTNSQLMKYLCGTKYMDGQFQFESTSSDMTIVFHSNKSTSGSFQFKYKSEQKAKNTVVNCTNINLKATSTAAYLTSPNYPNRYPSSMDCQWHITADSDTSRVVIEIQKCALEGNSPSYSRDYLKFYDGPTADSNEIITQCGTLRKTVISSTNQVITIAFHSDQYNNYDGFSFKYFTKEKPVPCTSVNLLATRSSNSIRSPSYSADGRFRHCLWVIRADSDFSVISVEFTDFLMLNSICIDNKEYVAVYDGPTTDSKRISLLCGGTQRFNSTISYMTIEYYSRWKAEGRFTFTYRSIERTRKTAGRPNTVNCTNIKLVASSSAAYLTSPNYPSNYPSSMDCRWHLTADTYSYSSVVVIEIQQFTLEENMWFEQPRDYVRLYDGPTVDSPLINTLYGRGYTRQRFHSTNQVLTVVFHSDQYNNYKGFSFKYFTMEKQVPCRSVNLLATKFISDIYSPSYSADGRSMDCVWVIKTNSDSSVVFVEYSGFLMLGSMGSTDNDQYITVYDGPTTTSTPIASARGSPAQFSSTNSSMTIQYYSRWKSSERFKFTYWSQEPTNNIVVRPTFVTVISSTRIIIGGIVASAAVFSTFIIIVCLVCLKRRINRTWRRNTWRGISNPDTLSPEVITQSPVSNIVSPAASDPIIPPPTYMEVQNRQSITDLPSYSSICAQLNNNSLGSASRTPDYSQLDPPPSYFSVVNNTGTSQRNPAAQPSNSRTERSPNGDQNATRMPTSEATGIDLSTRITPVMFRPSYFSTARHPRNSGNNRNLGASQMYASVPHIQHEH